MPSLDSHLDRSTLARTPRLVLRRRPSFSAAAIAALALTLIGAIASVAAAEQGWVHGQLRLNLRTGAGNEYRIIGTVATGDAVQVLHKAEDWTRIQTADGKVGWIPGGYVEPTPPPITRLATAEAKAVSLEAELEKLRGETTSLRETNTALSENDAGQEQKLETLELENLRLRAVSRYQEWLTGAALLVGGMLAGAWLHNRSANRRPSTRIRL